MQLHTYCQKSVAAALVSLAVFVASARPSGSQEPVAPPPAGSDSQGVETLTRGPVHEAFATPTASDPKPNPIVKKKPPIDIDEVQPDVRPEGSIWVNGYWEFDKELDDYIWISGLWRVPPPEMRWVPPYWTEVDGGWQRVTGFWISTSAGQLDYRPVPPNSLEVGPNSPAPADNYFYIPGSWSYYDSGYRWRSGYWSPYREDWVWCPARWIWTPAGCLYQSGYWDHRPLVRAQLFAPVRFTSQVYLTPGWRYRPWCVVDHSRLFVHLWIGPQSNCYYFGNYYGSHFHDHGFTPWSSWSYGNRGCYDPLWSWSHVHYRRQGIDYIGRCRGWYDHYDKHEHDRPARTWNEQQRLIVDAKLDPRKSQRVLTADLHEVAKRDDLPIRLAKLNDDDRESVRKVADDMKKLNIERHKIEREARVARDGGDNSGNERKEGDKPGRGPRTDIAKPSGERKPNADSVVVTKSGEPKPGEVGPAEVKSDADKASDKVTSRLDKLNEKVDSGANESKKSARMKLPEQTDAIHAVTRGGRGAPRGADRAGSDNDDRTPRIKVEGDTVTAGKPAPSGVIVGESASEKPGKSDKPAGDVSRNTKERAGSGREEGQGNRGNTIRVRGNSPATVTGPDVAAPQVELPRASSGNGPKGELPKINSNSSSPPKIESRSNRSSDDSPRTTQPRIEQPKFEAPKIEARSNRSSEGSGRSSQPRIESPSGGSSRTEAPKIESRSRSSSSSPSGGGPTRIEAPRTTSPRIESAPRSSPRIEVQRGSAGSQNNSSRGGSSASAGRSSSGGNSGSAGRSSGGGGSRGRSRGDDD